MVYCNTTVGISIICKTDIQSVIHHIFLKYFNMRGSTRSVDVCSIRVIVNDISFCTQSVKNTLCDRRRTSVGAIQTNFDIFEIAARNGDQVSDITIASGSKIYGTSNIFSCCIWKFFNLAIQICFDSCLNFSFNLLSVSVQKFDSIIVEWIVTCRDHDSTVKIFCTYCIGNTRCSRYMKQICICT